MTGRLRGWLMWTPPLVVTALLLIGLRVTAGDESGSVSGSEPTVTAGDGAAGVNTPTTGFANRVPVLPDEPFDYGTELPAHMADVARYDSSPADNQVTDAGATLGRVLFYDVNLSRNRTVRCASCHVQVHSFTDPLLLSQGVDGARTRRNSMALANAAFSPSGRYLWDEAAITLEDQVLMPFEDRLEMDISVPDVLDRINESDYYGPLFAEAFGDETVTGDRVAAALAQFIRAMVSANAPYDQGRARVEDALDDFPNFTDEENEGKALFLTPRSDGGAGCASCHSTEAQISGVDGLKNNGIDPPSSERLPDDLGAFEPTGDPTLAGSFRVPSLRNVEVTGPFMHDGRLVGLEDVIEHYSQGVQPHENLSPELLDDDGQPARRPFTGAEVDALLAFLKTLTDDEFLQDPRFAEPFRTG